MQKLEAGEIQLAKVFTEDYEFRIPDYQRPYAWGTEEALQLLSDLDEARRRDDGEPYFLGSIVLVKEHNSRASYVIDGQQRLTTLTLLFACLRDLVQNPQLASELQKRIETRPESWEDSPTWPRLRLRDLDDHFFQAHVVSEGHTGTLAALPDHQVNHDAQKAIRDNAAALRTELGKLTQTDLSGLYTFVARQTFLVVVSTPTLTSAYRIFSVMNARGLPLEASDIIKSKVIGAIADRTARAHYAKRWEEVEVELGRDQFAELFLHLRTLAMKTRGVKSLLQEFEEFVLPKFLPGAPEAFIDDLLAPYAEATKQLLQPDFDPADAHLEQANHSLKMLGHLNNQDWKPVALWIIHQHGAEPTVLALQLRRLERLAASLQLQGSYTTPRVNRYIEVLKQLELDPRGDVGAFGLSDLERAVSRGVIDGPIYQNRKVARFLLLTVDQLLSKNSGVRYDHPRLSIEHVLPQNPEDDSSWTRLFDEEARNYWTDRIGNLVLLSRSKNAQQGRKSFAEKRTGYFTTRKGVANFSLTSQVLSRTEWTAEVVDERQKELTEMLFKEWELR